MLDVHVIATKPGAMILTSRNGICVYAEEKYEEPRNGKQSVAAFSILIRQSLSILSLERELLLHMWAQLVLPVLGLCIWCNKT